MEPRIKHMVMFCLKHDTNSELTKKFLSDGEAILCQIPGVENFFVFKQISKKNDYDYVFSMEFASQAVYDSYNTHPLHIDFVESRWKKEIASFKELDLQLLQNEQ